MFLSPACPGPAQRGSALCAVDPQQSEGSAQGEFTSPEHFNPNGPQRDHPVGRKPGYEEQKAALEARL